MHIYVYAYMHAYGDANLPWRAWQMQSAKLLGQMGWNLYMNWSQPFKTYARALDYVRLSIQDSSVMVFKDKRCKCKIC